MWLLANLKLRAWLWSFLVAVLMTLVQTEGKMPGSGRERDFTGYVADQREAGMGENCWRQSAPEGGHDLRVEPEAKDRRVVCGHEGRMD